MSREILLRRVAAAHVALLVASALALAWLDHPIDGLVLGGALAGFSFVTFWAVARTLVEPGRKALAYALGSLKILLYFGLTAAVLSGRLVADPLGFALGVTCFVVAAIAVALAATRPQSLTGHYGSV